ncbi:MAG: hypothetical protein H7222_15190 [Methylotenera sp.]|nr:hypothetical protein [Oligoflexia bacterium]
MNTLNELTTPFENQDFKTQFSKIGDTVGNSFTSVKSSKYTRPVLWTLGLGAAAYGLFRLYQYSTNRFETVKTDKWAEQLEAKLGGPEKSARKPSGPIMDRASDRGVKDIHSA